MKIISADELLTMIKASDKMAFDHVFRIYYRKLCKYAFHITNDINTAEDIVQDIFFYLWTNHKLTDKINSLDAYLRTAVYNRSVTYLKEARKKRDNLLSPNQYLDLENLHLEILQYRRDMVTEKELVVTIARAIESLSEQCRIVFKLSRNFGMKNSDIAEHLEISIKAVEKNITKALRHLRLELKDFMH
jgi:RNA polymerase sigma-70 factor (ECF subfamily)